MNDAKSRSCEMGTIMGGVGWDGEVGRYWGEVGRYWRESVAALVMAFCATCDVSGHSGDVVVRLVSLERMPSVDAADCRDDGICRAGSAPGTRLIRVNIALSLPPGASPVPLDILAGTSTGIGLFAGADRRPLAVDCGNLAETAILCTDQAVSVPTVVDPAAPVVLSESFDVPDGALADLTATITPPVRGGQAPAVSFTASV
jgi:hypothetical protein